MGMRSHKKDNDKILKRLAIQIVAQLPRSTKDAQRVLELAQRLVEKVDEPWKLPRQAIERRPSSFS